VIIISCLIGPPAARVGLAAGYAKARLQKKWVSVRIYSSVKPAHSERQGVPPERGVNPAQGMMAMNPRQNG
jgi:hypothetical protein